MTRPRTFNLKACLLTRLNRFFTQVRVCAAVILCSGFLLSGVVHADAKQEAELKQLQENIAKLQKELQEVKGTRSELQQNLQKSESEMGELIKKIDQIQRDMKQQDKQLDELNQERKQLQDARLQQQSQVAEQVQVAYRMGQQSQLKLLLNQESPERLTRMLAYHQRIFNTHSEKLAAYLDTINQLDALEPKIVDRRQALAANKQQLDREREKLKQQQSQRQQILAKVNNTLKTKDDELRQLQEDRQRLQTLLQEVARAVGTVPLPGSGATFSSRKGRLPWPAAGKLSSRFGSPRIGGQTQWNGILISAVAGQPVIAVHRGRIVFADYFRGHGLLVIIDHGEGYLSLYAHNQSLLRATGEWVEAGQAIASVGNSGGQEKTGLYFEIRHQGKPTDPGTWLARA